MTKDLSLGFDFSPDFQPLAARMRPVCFDDYLGQEHLLGNDKPLRKALEAGRAHSMILWGPPGTGKTTLAELIAHYVDAHVERISAVTSGVKDIRNAITQAQHVAQAQSKQTLLFVDEVHRFNKSQQDAFLPYIEDGTVMFVGATTENPSFELNNALLSRARVYQVKPIDSTALAELLQKALADNERGLGHRGITAQSSTLDAIAGLASGDARKALNLLELACDQLQDGDELGIEHLSQVSGVNVGAFDKGGDAYYDLLSAFHKSIRGSNPDAALYWYARMIVAGGDPLMAARRLLAIASEDVGNADPQGMVVALNAWDCFHRVGRAEGERAIAQAAVYLACAPKSNAVYLGFKRALALAEKTQSLEVPHHIRNAPTQLMKDLGYGAQYRYAHDEDNAYAAGEAYLPEEIVNESLYQPTDRGLEKRISEKLKRLQALDAASSQKRY
ncbi:replication-associated recombination protein A [Paraferrimonas haliotis]|uniref:Replication-associated recombination protein A n=1 Tax=Paraferrimonas haliotis TaxID=2013866 RepID=A0AA37TN96_9GAMM|nr:replication-associated recombination protein A [Paraferrimonas haliotis]GLS84652.1 ATPase AAA [Paraferrimonas haliotis]